MTPAIMIYWITAAIWPGPPPAELMRFPSMEECMKTKLLIERQSPNRPPTGCVTQQQFDHLRADRPHRLIESDGRKPEIVLGVYPSYSACMGASLAELKRRPPNGHFGCFPRSAGEGEQK